MKAQVKDSGTEDQMSVLDMSFQTFAHDHDEWKALQEGGKQDAAAEALVRKEHTLQAAAWCADEASKGKGSSAAKRKRAAAKAAELAAAQEDELRKEELEVECLRYADAAAERAERAADRV
jgi:hypothetical protein